MLDYLLELYRATTSQFLFVVQPGVEAAIVERGRARGVDIACDVQLAPTGMLDAILIPLARVRSVKPAWVWITWCDQVAILPETVSALRRLVDERPGLQLALPTCRQPDPYIHFERDGSGRIAGLRQRREGDAMPDSGESDAGLFVLKYETYAELLPLFARDAPRGRATGERNFLPFVPWLSARCPGSVLTVPCHAPIESIGINTPDDLRRVEAHLASRQAGGSPPAS
jgi:CTP:molybdopterin cytidylyltransferase MocA